MNSSTDSPFRRTQVTESADKFCVKEGLTAPERHSAARRAKIQIVDPDSLKQLFRCHKFLRRFFEQTPVYAVAAAERTAGAGRERRHALSVRSHAQPRESKQRKTQLIQSFYLSGHGTSPAV